MSSLLVVVWYPQWENEWTSYLFCINTSRTILCVCLARISSAMRSRIACHVNIRSMFQASILWKCKYTESSNQFHKHRRHPFSRKLTHSSIDRTTTTATMILLCARDTTLKNNINFLCFCRFIISRFLSERCIEVWFRSILLFLLIRNAAGLLFSRAMLFFSLPDWESTGSTAASYNFSNLMVRDS